MKVLLGACAAGCALAASSASFESKWDPTNRRAAADAASANATLPVECELAVVGAGWGGAYLAWQGVMTPTFTKGLSSVSMQLTIPALLFSTVLPSVDFRLITSAWPLLLMPAVYVLVGCAIGVVVVAVCQPPADFRRGTIAAIAFGNSTGMAER